MAESEPRPYHVPVMLQQVIQAMAIQPGGHYLDGTLGGGGHSEAIKRVLGEGGTLVAVDRDDDAIAEASARLGNHPSLILHKTSFSRIGADPVVLEHAPYHGILFDFGVSSHQIDEDERGFSFQRPGPLDMRMDRTQPLTAAEVVNRYAERELLRVLRDYGEEPRARRIVSAVLAARPLETTGDLADVIGRVVGERDRTKTLARVFQALRIEVNGELEEIDRALDAAYGLLAPGGKLVTLSYHSLEDRRVKRFLRRMEGESQDRFLAMPGKEAKARMRATPRKAVTPTEEEIATNPRARSARMRVGEKLR